MRFFVSLLIFLPLSAWAEQALDIVPTADIIPTSISEETQLPDQTSANPKDKSKLEEAKVSTDSHWGAAAGAAWIHDYPGAEDGRMRYLVMPTYKGKNFTIDRQDGVRGELVNESIVKFSFSFIFIFPTKSEKIPLRAGMPDLDWTFQIGPELQVYLLRSFYHTIYFRLPWRAVISTDFSHDFEYRDWNLSPGIRHVYYLGKGLGEITTRLDFDIASERYNDLFYQVDPKFATSTRPAYNARAGMQEYIVGVNYAYYDSFPWTYFIGANAYITDVSVNKESPLHARTLNYSIIGGIIRYF